MPEHNLLKSYPKARRNLGSRKKGQAENRAIARRFGCEYFDGTRDQGYGGYRYDGRWVSIARDIVQRYDLAPGDCVLDAGCAKGFLVKDLLDVCPGLEVYGLDVSSYALTNAHPDVAGRLIRGSAEKLPFATGSLNAVICINVIHNLERTACIRAIQEVQRVSGGRGYIQVDAYRSEEERSLFLDWVLTAVTYGPPEFWRQMFEDAGYTGDYYWTIIENDRQWLVRDDQSNIN
jgi:ubiquinone/menaquinone biosynthesis C-methylase UbiE